LDGLFIKDLSQVITKDEEHYLDVDLHTDLLNKSERDKVKNAGGKVVDLVKAIVKTNKGGIGNIYKESQFGRRLDDLNSPGVLKILGHELGHLNNYDTGAAKIVRVNVGAIRYLIRNINDVNNNNLITEVTASDDSIGFGTPDAGIGVTITYLPNANSEKDVTGWVFSAGGTIEIPKIFEIPGSIGMDFIFNRKGNPIGMRYTVSISVNPIEGHAMADYSYLYEAEKYLYSDRFIKYLDSKFIDENGNPKTTPSMELMKEITDYIKAESQNIKNDSKMD
jgi:hypothetical protein